MITRTDITNYSEHELSLLVYNDEWLYNKRNSPYLKVVLDTLFIYNKDQWDELSNDLEEEKED